MCQRAVYTRTQSSPSCTRRLQVAVLEQKENRANSRDSWCSYGNLQHVQNCSWETTAGRIPGTLPQPTLPSVILKVSKSRYRSPKSLADTLWPTCTCNVLSSPPAAAGTPNATQRQRDDRLELVTGGGLCGCLAKPAKLCLRG